MIKFQSSYMSDRMKVLEDKASSHEQKYIEIINRLEIISKKYEDFHLNFPEILDNEVSYFEKIRRTTINFFDIEYFYYELSEDNKIFIPAQFSMINYYGTVLINFYFQTYR